MAVEDAADRAGFFDSDEFGVTATYSVGGTVDGVFENEFFEALTETDVAVESAQLLFTCATADVPTAAHGQTLAWSGNTYAIVGVQPDGTGVTILVLEAQ